MTGLNYAVSSLMGMAAAAARLDATHCLSIGDSQAARPATPSSVQAALLVRAEKSPPAQLHLFMNFNDICKPGVAGGPEERHVRQIMRLGGGLFAEDRIVIHCHAGISRSTAAAWIADMEFRRMRGAEPGLELFGICREELRARRPVAMPNPVMMQIYLDILHGMDLARDVTSQDVTAMRFSGGDGLEFSIRAAGSVVVNYFFPRFPQAIGIMVTALIGSILVLASTAVSSPNAIQSASKAPDLAAGRVLPRVP